MQVSFEPVKERFVARVVGVDMTRPPDEAEVAAIEEAILHYPVLLFQGQRINDAQQAEYSGRFGTLQRATGYTQGPSKGRLDPVMTDASNIGTDQKTFGAGDRRRMNLLGSRRWHTDGSYKRCPAKFSFLATHAVPERGGETQYCDMCAAYDALSDDLKKLIANLTVEHSLIRSREVVGFPDEGIGDKEVLPPAHHPLVRRHPDTGRLSIYVSSHAHFIVGWPLPEGLDLLYELMDGATRPEFVYSHQWQLGDVVMWDNRVTMHRVRRHYPESAPRDMRRTSIEDTVPPLQQVA